MHTPISSETAHPKTAGLIVLGKASLETRGLSQGVEPDIGQTYFEEARINKD